MAKGKYKWRSVTCVREDRISYLTSHLLDSILERLPLEEAVRTSTLSKSWRYRWTTMKAIVFDEDFTNKFTKNREFDCDGFTRTINQVLSKNAVKNIIEITENHPYEVPSSVFYCPGLTKLQLETCFFKPPLNFEGFFNLTELTLDRVLFGPSLYGTRINLPQLKKLCLSQCIKASNFNIKTTKLHDLVVITCRDANFLQLLDNPYLKMVGISFRLIQDFDGIERLNLVSMLSNLPRVEDFLIEGNFLKFMSAEKFPKWLPRAISSLKLLMLADIQLGDLDQLHGALCLLRNSPNVEKLSIIHTEMDPRVDVGPALKHLETPNCLDYTLKQLQTVEILQLEGSRSELLFIKLLLANSPYLEKMTITPDEDLNVTKVLDIAKDVMRFPRASPKAEIVYLNPMY